MKQHITKALKLRRWVVIGHHIPGRVRLKYKLGLMAHLVLFNTQKVEQVIASIPAFKNYKINNSTSSILIEYDAEIVNPTLIDTLFSGSDQEAEQACYAIAQSLNLDGKNHA